MNRGSNDSPLDADSTSGVDTSLIRYLLSLSPLERLTLMERAAKEQALLFEYGRRHREANTPTTR